MRSLLLLALAVALVACGDGTDPAETTLAGTPTTAVDATTPETTAATTTAPETTAADTTTAETTMAPTTAPPTTVVPTTVPPTTATESTVPPDTTSPSEEASEIISPSGFWEVRVGETIGENEDRMGLPLQDVGGDPNHCMVLELPEVGGIYFIGSTLNEQPVDGRAELTLGRVSADSPGWLTENGIEVGMSVEEAESILGDTITERKPHFYVDEGEYLIVGPEDSRYIFETDGDSITAIHAGMEPVVSYVEACS